MRRRQADTPLPSICRPRSTSLEPSRSTGRTSRRGSGSRLCTASGANARGSALTACGTRHAAHQSFSRQSITRTRSCQQYFMRAHLTLTRGGSLLWPGLSSCRAGNSRYCGFLPSGVPLRVPWELSSSRPPLRLWAATTRSRKPLRAGPRAPAPPGAGMCAESWRLRRRPAVRRDDPFRCTLTRVKRTLRAHRPKSSWGADGRGGSGGVGDLDDGPSNIVRGFVERLYRSARAHGAASRRIISKQSLNASPAT